MSVSPESVPLRICSHSADLGQVNASASLGPPEVLTALVASSLLHEHPDVVDPRDVCAVLGVPLERTVETLAWVTSEDRLLLAALPGHARGCGTAPSPGRPESAAATCRPPTPGRWPGPECGPAGSAPCPRTGPRWWCSSRRCAARGVCTVAAGDPTEASRSRWPISWRRLRRRPRHRSPPCSGPASPIPARPPPSPTLPGPTPHRTGPVRSPRSGPAASAAAQRPATCRIPHPATLIPHPAEAGGGERDHDNERHPAPPRVQRERSRGGDGEGRGRHHR